MPKMQGKRIKGEKVAYRICVYWEEAGTTAEGGMNDERVSRVKRMPTRSEMTKITRRLDNILDAMDLLQKEKDDR